MPYSSVSSVSRFEVQLATGQGTTMSGQSGLIYSCMDNYICCSWQVMATNTHPASLSRDKHWVIFFSFSMVSDF